MRMRHKKHADERLSACDGLLLEGAGAPFTDPAEQIFGTPGAKVLLEIGAGKGGFACGMVKQRPDAVYIAMERVKDCVVLAAERARDEGVSGNLRFAVETADDLTLLFKPGTVDEMFLNCSDPWSKKGYAKRRLTHARYLTVYMHLLKQGGRLTFKTDNVGLFDFTLEQLDLLGIKPDRLTRDLHSSEFNEGNVVTEYEAAFSAKGVSINMVSFVRPDGFDAPIEEQLSAQRKSYRPEYKNEEK